MFNNKLKERIRELEEVITVLEEELIESEAFACKKNLEFKKLLNEATNAGYCLEKIKEILDVQ